MAMPTKMLLYLDMFSAFNHALMDSTALGYEQSIVGRQVAEGAAKSTDHVRAAPHSEKARSARPMPSEGVDDGMGSVRHGQAGSSVMISRIMRAFKRFIWVMNDRACYLYT